MKIDLRMGSPVKKPGWIALALMMVMMQGAASASAAGREQSPGIWKGVSQVIAVGDLHGSYEKAVRLLRSADLLDKDHHWVGGDHHLVVTGDILDRGPSDRELMDLFRRLQSESAAAGGRVHVLLGNHEAMNLMRDLRYVNPDSYRAFAEDERDRDRRAAWQKYLDSSAAQDGKVASRSKFEADYPPGFFARQRSLDADGDYGRWLLGLPAIVEINDVVYLHGGLILEVATLGIEEINRRVGDDLRRHLAAREFLQQKGVVTPLMSFGEIRWMAKDGHTNLDRLSPELRRAVQDLYDTSYSAVLGEKGPLWYRGNAFEDERIERGMLERSLESLGARAMVVAHSPTTGRQITSRFHGQLYRIYHDISGSDTLQALVVESERILVLDATTGKMIAAPQELPTGRIRPRPASEMSDRELEKFLANAQVVDWRYLGRGTTRPRLVELEMGGASQRGIFKTVESDAGSGPAAITDRYEHEVAAYRVDRMIGLNMVPVAVLRTIDGQRGSLQSWVEGAVDQEAAVAYGLQFFKTDRAVDQLAQAWFFDSLIGNQDRGPDDVLSLTQGGELHLIDHSKAFSTSSELDWDHEETVSIDPRLLTEIQTLDRQTLMRQVGDLISEQQIDALLARRDKILAWAATTTARAPVQETRPR
jgi:3',5'-cyclic AMP phosphodiesterase CpdA